MTMPETNPATSDHGCPILDKLPVELRLIIYEFVCEGSQIHASPDLPAKNDNSPLTDDSAPILRHSGQFKLVLSCRTMYNEALDTYWSKTILRFNYPHWWQMVDRHSLTPVQSAWLMREKYSQRLCAFLPAAVKANVKHIRGMVLPSQKCQSLAGDPSLTAAALLGAFKELVTCDISPTFHDSFSPKGTRIINPSNKGFSRFEMKWGPQAPIDFLAESSGLDVDATAGVTFLCKGVDVHLEKLAGNMSVRLIRSRPRFWNFSTGVVFEDTAGNLDDEEGFKKVMQRNLCV